MDDNLKSIVRIEAALDYIKMVEEDLCPKCQFSVTGNLHRARSILEDEVDIGRKKLGKQRNDDNGGNIVGTLCNGR